MVAAWVAGAWIGTKEHVRQSFGATNREWNGSSPLHWKSQLNFNQTFGGARLPVSEADKSSVQKAARKSIPNWNINTCNHGSESTLLRLPVHINCRFPAALIIHKSWKLATGVRDNYVVSCRALFFFPLTTNSHLLAVLHRFYNIFMKVWSDCWVSGKSPVIFKAQRADVYCLKSVKLLFNKAPRV